MLQSLHIRNYAIIDELTIRFGERFNVITGETGAGKSILLGALSLILGQRADASVLKDKDVKCIIESIFRVSLSDEMNNFLAANDIDADAEIIVRRELSNTGTKSRSFINDTPVSLGQLKELASMLVDLHQQFDNLELTGKNFQIQLIDAMAGNRELLINMSRQFMEWQQVGQKLHNLELEQAAAQKEQDYNRFLYDELEEAALKENELEQLDDELKLLSNAEAVKADLAGLNYVLSEGENPVIQQLKNVQQKLSGITAYLPAAQELLQRIQSLNIELTDIAAEIESQGDKVIYDPQRIEEVNEKVAMGHRLLKKHGASSTAELLSIREELEEKLNSLVNRDQEIALLRKQQAELLKTAEATASQISSRRNIQAVPVAEKTNRLLKAMGMPNAAIQVVVETAPLSVTGSDAVTLLFDANKSGRFEPLSKVASGGELSRISLAVKSLVADKLSLPTLIFDEIDTGISGEAARQVGMIMKTLAESHQVIVVSHQPQVAAKGDTHLYVYKENKGKGIATNIRLLNEEERVEAVAQMIGGEKPTAAAIASARELVG